MVHFERAFRVHLDKVLAAVNENLFVVICHTGEPKVALDTLSLLGRYAEDIELLRCLQLKG